ncbi:hypothetical protein M0765_019635 [Variovorax sp. S2]|uniref:hypothetical protein n=1 Tax=Variovorax sp. S12S4 TaxID=3029170 RepID=UPI00215C5E65|nr:hypothetical protein [Variovorax sp. S12S4]MCR8959866.1 hypothetical protein [Variovorax sp. S12S4]
MANQDFDDIAHQAAREAWQRQCNDVTEAMKVHTRPFVVPLSTEDEREVRHVGTGSFLRWNGSVVLLTCEHVAAQRPTNLSFHGSDDVFSVGQPFVDEKNSTPPSFLSPKPFGALAITELT